MANDDGNPVIAVPQRAADTGPLLDFLDKVQRALQEASQERRRKLNARPIEDTLFVYAGEPAEREAVEAFARVRYGVAAPKGVANWDELIAELAKYRQVRRLVLFTHGTPGHLLIGVELLSGDELAVRFKEAVLTVTESVTFEGCSTMQNPAPMARAAQAVSSPQAIGYTWWHFLLFKGYKLPKEGKVSANSAKKIKDYFKSDGKFLLQPLRGGRPQITKAPDLITELERRAKDSDATVKVFGEMMRDGPGPDGPVERIKGDRARRSARKVTLTTKAEVEKFTQQDLHDRPRIVTLGVAGVLAGTDDP